MWRRYRFLVCIVVLQKCYSSDGEYWLKSCPDEQTAKGDAELNIDPVIEEITVRLGHFIELRCCAPSFSKIKWYKEGKGSWKPFVPLPPQFNPVAPTLGDNGQVLVIKSADTSDDGNYKCVLEKDGMEVDKRRMTLTVAECDELARGPYPIAPLPCDVTSISLGGVVTLPCNGYFGCGNDELRTVTWFVTDISGDPNWRQVSEVSDRYQIKYFQRNGNSELGANLTITNIEAADLDRKFMCLLSTPQIIQGESKVMVRLKHRQQTNKGPMVDSASMTTVVVALVAVVVGLTIVTVCIVLITVILRRKRNREKETQHSPTPEQEWMFSVSKVSVNA